VYRRREDRQQFGSPAPLHRPHLLPLVSRTRHRGEGPNDTLARTTTVLSEDLREGAGEAQRTLAYPRRRFHHTPRTLPGRDTGRDARRAGDTAWIGRYPQLRNMSHDVGRLRPEHGTSPLDRKGETSPRSDPGHKHPPACERLADPLREKRPPASDRHRSHRLHAGSRCTAPPGTGPYQLAVTAHGAHVFPHRHPEGGGSRARTCRPPRPQTHRRRHPPPHHRCRRSAPFRPLSVAIKKYPVMAS